MVPGGDHRKLKKTYLEIILGYRVFLLVNDGAVLNNIADIIKFLRLFGGKLGLMCK